LALSLFFCNQNFCGKYVLVFVFAVRLECSYRGVRNVLTRQGGLSWIGEGMLLRDSSPPRRWPPHCRDHSADRGIVVTLWGD